MKKLFLTLSLSLSLFTIEAQTYLPLTDNMSVGSNSSIKILGDNYYLQDAGNDGLIQINNASNIIIDGDSVYEDGQNFYGYLIKIDHSSNIIIKNFSAGKGLYYGVYCTNSQNIEIDNCNFSFNKVDSGGWIDVWSGYTGALGGGAMFYNCDSVRVHNCTMKLQNDGVALYNSAHIEIDSNDFAWNTSYGIRMYWTDSSHIHDNIAHHINRPFTDPSDCAALLLIVSKENKVERNDLSYSGDGVFLGEYQHSTPASNNYFAYNQCSGSPHNAVEATFADGNTFKHNLCDSSQYGFWLGYSYNSIIDSNEINYNQYSGISIERGFNNVITHNNFHANPFGVQLWEGSIAPGYENWSSHDYNISSNTFSGNMLAISDSATENMTMVNDSFLKNYSAIYFAGDASNERVAGSYFDASTIYDIQNNASDFIDADSNTFIYCDGPFIGNKIYDYNDNGGSGEVDITPYDCYITPVYQTSLPSDLAEPPSVWYPYPEGCGWLGITQPLTITWDSLLKHDGAASAHLSTGTGWYVDMNYRPDSEKIVQWDVSGFTHLNFWIYSINPSQYDFQFFHVRIGNSSGGYFRYNSSGSALNQSLNQWKNYSIPLSGGGGWTKQTIGTVSLSEINYVEVWSDTYDVGFDLWLDGVQFTEPSGEQEISSNNFSAEVFPNPFFDRAAITYHTAHAGNVTITITDLQGRILNEFQSEDEAGEHSIDVSKNQLAPGIYFCQLNCADGFYAEKIVVE
ncbi:MAG TPA: right-handed parallel beta-helix repeat-containing protein [Chitinophagales bacterium]|nr:right-handed parallel beta-helix repeat-containing protein [Chitinophagales bacterium]